jgi:hypothetical protein
MVTNSSPGIPSFLVVLIEVKHGQVIFGSTLIIEITVSDDRNARKTKITQSRANDRPFTPLLTRTVRITREKRAHDAPSRAAGARELIERMTAG